MGLGVVVSHNVGTGNQTLALFKKSVFLTIESSFQLLPLFIKERKEIYLAHDKEHSRNGDNREKPSFKCQKILVSRKT